MARALEFTPEQEKQIDFIWEKLIKKYPQLNSEEFPLDYTREDFYDEVRLAMMPDKN